MQIATFIVEFRIIVPNSLKLTMKTSHQSNTMLRCKNSLQIRNIVFLSQYTHLSLDIEGARNPWGGLHFIPLNLDLEASNSFAVAGVGSK